MKLHGNAALTLKKRQLLASRVVKEGASGARARKDSSTAPQLPNASTTARPSTVSR
jgi:hypothetical protein